MHDRLKETKELQPAKVILFEGILSLYTKEIRELFDMRIFVDCDSDERLARRGMSRGQYFFDVDYYINVLSISGLITKQFFEILNRVAVVLNRFFDNMFNSLSRRLKTSFYRYVVSLFIILYNVQL